MRSGTTRKAPPAFTHGATSRWIMEALEEDVAELTRRVVGSASDEPGIAAAARQFAEATIRLRHIRSIRTQALNKPEPRRPGTLDVAAYSARLNAFLSGKPIGPELSRRQGGKTGEDTQLAMLERLEQSADTLARLDDYERRELSKRSKALRQLDYLRIEAERRRVGRQSPWAVA